MSGVTGLCVLLVAVFVALAAGACPNNCNTPNGSCVAGRCICRPTYAGDDCSYIYAPLDGRGGVLTGSVPTFGWSYYYMTANKGSELIFNINQTSTSGDCDVYINRLVLPTRSLWIRRDISTKKTMTIVLGSLETTETGLYIAGIYGFIGCSYSISGINKGQVSCPQNCSGHGVCSPTGLCNCRGGWTGLACDTPSSLSDDGTPIVDSVAQREWKYYQTQITQVPTILYYNMTQTSPGDADIYVQWNEAPTLNDFMASNTTMERVSTIQLEVNRAGTYFVGVLGYWSGSNPGGHINFTLSLLGNQQFFCSNTTRCSEHGTCLANQRCSCNQYYEGPNCETFKQSVTLGMRVHGYVADSKWNYYRYLGVTSQEVTITMNHTVGGDCDLYVRAGQRPTLTIFDYVNLDQETVVNLTIPEPLNNWWHIGVFGWRACRFSLIINDRTSRDCGNGTWSPDIDGCICNDGWTGINCDQRTNVLKNGVIRNGTVTNNNWVYFSFELKNTHTLDIRLLETNSSRAGSIWLYMSRSGYPDLFSYDKADTVSLTRTHYVTLTSPNAPMNGYAFIGVYGSPYGVTGQSHGFSLVAWSPDI